MKALPGDEYDQDLARVSEAGAPAVYSASELRSAIPPLDVNLRGGGNRSPAACRIRSAELVKIDPKSISVGQYQHGGNQSRLA